MAGRAAQHLVGDRLAEQGFAVRYVWYRPPSRAHTVRYTVPAAKQGFTVRYTAPVAERGDGQGGFVDLVARRQARRLASEVDGRAPRRGRSSGAG